MMEHLSEEIERLPDYPFVHCASHNLNLVINDALEVSIDILNFCGTVEEIYAFFSKSLNRWAELALTEDTVNKLNLKRLCGTRVISY